MASFDDDKVRNLLTAKNFAHLSTLREDGTVHNAVIWIDVDGARAVINSAEGRAWPRNLRRDPRLTLSVHNQDNPYEAVEIRGRVVEEQTGQPAFDHIDAMAQKYFGREKYPLAEGEERIKFFIEPEKVLYRKAN